MKAYKRTGVDHARQMDCNFQIGGVQGNPGDYLMSRRLPDEGGKPTELVVVPRDLFEATHEVGKVKPAAPSPDPAPEPAKPNRFRRRKVGTKRSKVR